MWDNTDQLANLNRLRRNVIIHSVIYYRFNRNIIENSDYDQLCNRLAKMQEEHPELCEMAVFSEDFRDYDRCTGMQFIDHEWGVRAAERLLKSYRGGKR